MAASVGLPTAIPGNTMRCATSGRTESRATKRSLISGNATSARCSTFTFSSIRSLVEFCVARISLPPPVSVGETQSEGKGRPAPLPRPVPAASRCPCQSEPTRRIRPPGSQLTFVPRLVATCDTGSGAGGHASTFRTALSICPRPVMSHFQTRRHGRSTHHPIWARHKTGSNAGMPSIEFP
jgi:hypothetical protein